MIAIEYVVARWADGSLTITGWGLVIALTLILAYALWTAGGNR